MLGPPARMREGAVKIMGTIYWTSAKGTVGLVVDDTEWAHPETGERGRGVIVETPPWGKSWAYLRPARPLWDAAHLLDGVDAKWIPAGPAEAALRVSDEVSPLRRPYVVYTEQRRGPRN
jgi:hypothetical protein